MQQKTWNNRLMTIGCIVLGFAILLKVADGMGWLGESPIEKLRRKTEEEMQRLEDRVLEHVGKEKVSVWQTNSLEIKKDFISYTFKTAPSKIAQISQDQLLSCLDKEAANAAAATTVNMLVEQCTNQK